MVVAENSNMVQGQMRRILGTERILREERGQIKRKNERLQREVDLLTQQMVEQQIKINEVREMLRKALAEEIEEMQRQRMEKAKEEAKRNKKTEKDNSSEDEGEPKKQTEKMQVDQPEKIRPHPQLFLEKRANGYTAKRANKKEPSLDQGQK